MRFIKLNEKSKYKIKHIFLINIDVHHCDFDHWTIYFSFFFNVDVLFIFFCFQELIQKLVQK